MPSTSKLHPWSAACAASAMALAAMPLQARPIDNFFDRRQGIGPYFLSSNPSATVLRTEEPAWMPGVTRTLDILPQTDQPGFLRMQPTGETLQMDANSGQLLNTTISYGLDRPMNLDISRDFGIDLHFTYAIPHKLTVYAWTDSATPGGDAYGSGMTVDVGDQFGTSVLLPLSYFSVNSATGVGVNWADVDRFSFAFSHGGNPSYSLVLLYSISTVALPVPEPATAATMLAGLVLIGARALRRRSMGS